MGNLSLVYLMKTKPRLSSEAAFWRVHPDTGWDRYTVRDVWWKMILDPDGQPQYLYNLLHDRYEGHRLIRREPDRVRTIRQQFDIYRASEEG